MCGGCGRSWSWIPPIPSLSAPNGVWGTIWRSYEQQKQGPLFLLPPGQIRPELLGNFCCGTGAAEYLPGGGLPGSAVRLQAGLAKEPGGGNGLGADGTGIPVRRSGGQGDEHAGQHGAKAYFGHRSGGADSL